MDEFCGGDLWSDVINEFENVKIDGISPLHSPSQLIKKVLVYFGENPDAFYIFLKKI